MFIDRIYRINHTETWNFNAPTLVTSVSHKITAKCGILCPKTLLLTEKQLHAIHFLVATHNVCPLAIPEPWDVKSPHNEAFSETARLIWRRVNSTNVYALRINLKIECSESGKCYATQTKVYKNTLAFNKRRQAVKSYMLFENLRDREDW